MSKPAPSVVLSSDRPQIARASDVVTSSFLMIEALVCAMVMAMALMLAGSAAAEDDEPAVADTNFRLVGNFEYGHVDAVDVFRFRPGPATVVNTTEVVTESGGLTGILTLPLGDALGARVYGGFIGSKTYADGFDDIIQTGMLLGGDAFLRDPNRYEVGFGVFYSLSGSEISGRQELNYSEQTRVAHSLGARSYGKLFFGNRDDLPIDLDLSVRFVDADLDATDSDTGAERTYETRAGVKLYPSDVFSVRGGGVWSHTNFGKGASIEDRFFELDAELLVPTSPGVTIHAGFFGGKREQSSLAYQSFGRNLLGIHLGLTLNFAGADSLVDLHRRYF